MPGYDERVWRGKPQQGYLRRVSTGVVNRSHGHWKQDTVRSFRNNPREKTIPDHVMDPYHYFLKEIPGQKRDLAIANGAVGSDQPGIQDTGHPFRVEKRKFLTSHSGLYYSFLAGSAESTRYIGGPVIAADARLTSAAALRLPFSLQDSGSALTRRTFGSLIPTISDVDAVNSAKRLLGALSPARPVVDLPLLLGELLMGFPSAMGALLYKALRPGGSFLKGSSDEFLNYMFGIAPTVRDLTNLANALLSLSERILQYQRDAGREVRRVLRTDPVRKDETFSGADFEYQGQILVGAPYYSYGPSQASQAQHPGSYQAELHVSEVSDDQFTGSYSYFIPVSRNFEKNLEVYVRSLNHVIQLAPSPETAWNLLPWSWLMDWFVEISKSLRSAAIVQDTNLVVNYAYLTRRVVRTTRLSMTYLPTSGNLPPWKTVHSIASLDVKTRVRANPFGFITPNSPEFTPLKFGILAALGISRVA